MKKLLLAFMAITLFACSSDDTVTPEPDNGNPENPLPVEQCSNVFDGRVILSTQEEVDNFAQSGYCGITGDLQIGSRAEFENGDVTIIDSDITNIEALSTLKFVGGGMYITQNKLLTSLNGLHNVVKTGYNIRIEENDLITSLQGLNSLKIVGEKSDQESKIDIVYNPSLVTLEGFDSLKEVKMLFIYDNNALVSLKGLESLEVVDWILGVESNENLVALDGLDNLKMVGALILQSYNVASIEALQNLTSAETITIAWTGHLTDLKGLDGLTGIGRLELFGNYGLVSLNGLQNLTIANKISISGNTALSSISHLSGLTSIISLEGVTEWQMTVSDNDLLTSLDGLQNISQFKGKGWIGNNETLTNLCAIQNLITNGEFTVPLTISANAYNPTAEDIIAGNCSQ